MSITTITVGGIGHISYASLAEADGHLAVDPVRSTAWAALSDPQKEINLVAATNRLDLLRWTGSKAGDESAQPNAWPRTGVKYPDGSAVPDDEVPAAVERATALLAGSIALSAKSSQSGTSGSNIKAVGAGTARVEFFRPTNGKALQDETAYALVQPFLTGFSVSMGVASGTDVCPTSSDPYGLHKGYA